MTLKRLRVTLVYEYNTDPRDYQQGNDPFAMAEEDFATDPAAAFLLADSWTLERAVFIPTDGGEEPR